MDVNRDPLGPGAVPKMLPCSSALWLCLGSFGTENSWFLGLGMRIGCSLHHFACSGLSAPSEPTPLAFPAFLVWRGDVGQRTAVDKPGPCRSYQDTVRSLPGKSDRCAEDSDHWYWYLCINSGGGGHRVRSCGLCSVRLKMPGTSLDEGYGRAVKELTILEP